MLSDDERQELEEFIKDLDEMDQDSLIALFFDWYDWYNENPVESTLLRLRALRIRINVHTTTGVRDSKL